MIIFSYSLILTVLLFMYGSFLLFSCSLILLFLHDYFLVFSYRVAKTNYFYQRVFTRGSCVLTLVQPQSTRGCQSHGQCTTKACQDLSNTILNMEIQLWINQL